jgi:hypothetical protein
MASKDLERLKQITNERESPTKIMEADLDISQIEKHSWNARKSRNGTRSI